MYIVDSHCDSIERVRRSGDGLVNPYNFSRIRPQLQFTALFTAGEGVSPSEAHRRMWLYLRRFRLAMVREADAILQVRTYGDIVRALSEGKHGALLTLESGTPLLGDPAVLRALHGAGVRVVGLTWLGNDLAKSDRLAPGEADTGLTAVGRAMVAAGNRLGIIFDVSHASDRTFWDLAEAAEKPFIATHSDFRALCPHSRNLTDDMAREIFRRGGMIGLNLCPKFIATVPEGQTVETLFRHLDHGLSLGGEEAMGFGCDIDGTGGQYPVPLTEEGSIHDRLIEMMLRHGYTDALVRKIAGENYLSYLRKHL